MEHARLGQGRYCPVGHVVLDVVIHEGGIGHSAGGTAGNVAANLAYFGWDSTVAAQHGDDPAGRHLRADLARAGVAATALIQRQAMTTPVVLHEVLSASHRFRFGCPQCGRRFANFRPLPPKIAARIVQHVNPDLLFVDRVSRASALMAHFVRDRGGLVVFEPSMESGSDRFRKLVELAHILKFSADRHDAQDPELRPGSSSQLQIVTAGAEGARWRRGRGRWRDVAAFQTDVVDAGGAGDWTTAALIAALGCTTPDDLANQDIPEALRRAQAVAALSCQVLGARGLSTALSRKDLKKRVDALIRSGKPTQSTRRLPREGEAQGQLFSLSRGIGPYRLQGVTAKETPKKAPLCVQPVLLPSRLF